MTSPLVAEPGLEAERAQEMPPAPTRASALYEGTIRHRRFEPVEHSFAYPVFMAYLDLAELPQVLDEVPFFSARRAAPVRYRREDFMGDAAEPLSETVRHMVEAATGRRPAGPVRLLTGLRHFGHSFNPVSFYYCFEPGGDRVEAVVADVKNIPWGERHPYVLSCEADHESRVIEGSFEKALHVSPLMGMDYRYTLRTTEPGETISVQIDSTPGSDPLRNAHTTPRAKAFDATLSLRRRELDAAGARRMVLRYPLMSLRVVAGIYWQALKLKRKGAVIHPHPDGEKPRGFIAP